ncbi:MAG TPA: hypothetical protein VMX17_07580, partial [Candidatus Glassbacteria bacterium]|nr:hypothetical protein [Candidatus Glassbacteria bacterium]
MFFSVVSQDDLTSRRYSTNVGYVTQYPVTIYDSVGAVSTLVPAAWRRVVVDISTLSSRYSGLASNSRTLPLYLILVDSSGDTPQVLGKTDDVTYDQVKIIDINGYFVY